MRPEDRLKLTREQLAKVQTAWLGPTDWSDLTIYGMHACENAIVAAADHLGLPTKKTHWGKVDTAKKLHAFHGLPDIADLLNELNELRKGFAYGEVTIEPSMDPEDIAAQVEEYVEAVSRLIEQDTA